MSARARLRRAAQALAVAGVLAGCATMPTGGPVVPHEASGDREELPGVYFDPKPPQPGESATEIVSHFMEAMKASPIKTTVAQEFLTAEAREAWAPEEKILTYSELGDPTGTAPVTLELTDVSHYDDRGAWTHEKEEVTIAFGLAKEGGEWRIDRVPDALIVPDSWFEDWYERVSLYFFDPTAEILVPEPVFVPKGDQFASSLVRGLLTEPSDPRVSRTFFPEGTSTGLSVPIDAAGVAEVSLSGDPDAVDEQTAQRMLTQLVWTLRQEPRVEAVTMSIGGREFGGGPTRVNLDVGGVHDPNGAQSTADLFALAKGRLVRGSVAGMAPVAGPLGQAAVGLRSIGVNLAGTRAGGVTDDGATLVLAPVEQPDGVAQPVLSGATDLLPPAWDFRDRIWLVDRTSEGATVIMMSDGRARRLQARGISGSNVVRMLVSRDGSRLVALVRGRTTDRVVVSRVQHSATGRVVGLTPARPLSLPVRDVERIRDIAWRSPTAVSMLSITDELSEIRTVSVDGAEGEITTEGSTRMRGRASSLVSSPLEGSGVFAVAGRTITDVTQPERDLGTLPRRLTSLTFAG